MRTFSAPGIIERKRDGHPLSNEEISWLIDEYCNDRVPDYQMAAFAMAVYFAGMTGEETAWLTTAMVDSGDRLAFPAGSPPKVDKHSTGGVGDKVSLVLAPLLACADRWVPMISGRGLGTTGGTLDKLESIPGFDVNLSIGATISQLERIGVAMIGQTAEICPADRRLYALRDVTGTVPSRPLIVSSIMSKKIAESLDALVLDVKFGSGAFMKTREEAESLANELEAVAAQIGLEFHVRLNPMDEPLGRAVGNSLEVLEAIECLRGQGPADLREIVLDLAEPVAGVDRTTLEGWLDGGEAYQKFESLVSAQGGDLDAFGGGVMVVREVPAPASGVVREVDAQQVARLSLDLGAGRTKASDRIDPAVGVDRLVKSGESVVAGSVLGRIHAGGEPEADVAAARLQDAVRIT